MKAVSVIALVLFLATTHVQAGASTSSPAASEAPSMAEGEVRKVDKEAGKVTLKHGRIEHLDMPPMTMVFRAADPKVLDGLKEGDKVRFSADRVNGTITVTRIEAAN